MCVTVARFVEQFKLMVAEIEHAALQFHGEFSSAWPMFWISHLVPSPRVVQDSKQLNHFDIRTGFIGEPQADFQHTSPMSHAVVAVERKGVVFKDGFQDQGDVQGHVATLPRLPQESAWVPPQNN